MTVRSKAFSIRIDNQEGQVLHIAYFVLSPNTQFIERIKTTGTRCRSGLEAQNLVVTIFVSPPCGQFVQLPFEVGHKHALFPGKERRHNETNPLPAPRRSVTENVLGTGVPQVMNFTPFIAPGSNVDPFVVQKARRLDIGRTSVRRVLGGRNRP